MGTASPTKSNQPAQTMFSDLSNLRFWAKTTTGEEPGIDVFHHTRNVGYVARLLADQRLQTLERFRLSATEVSVMAAFHDIGKISQGFQAKCEAWLKQTALEQRARLERWNDPNLCEPYHDRVSQFSIAHFLRARGMSPESSDWWAVAVGAHHGHLHDPVQSSFRNGRPGMKNDGWEEERQRTAQRLVEALGNPPNVDINDRSPVLWWLAGLITVSDWIGSDERFFPTDVNPVEDQARCRALEALEFIGFAQPEIRPGLSFTELFHLHDANGQPAQPNDLQTAAYRSINEPGIYVIEAPMGIGKTEAALWATYRLMCEGKASGIYFALPTQVTSNRVQIRVADFISRMCANAEKVRLIHANSWLLDIPQPRLVPTHRRSNDDSDARSGRDWFASVKRALIAPFGVGTVDQALLSIVAARHFFVRRFALAGKVVVIDEVHSYDVYTGTLVRCLCEELLPLGCTIILLSATLTHERRNKLLRLDTISSDTTTEPYPLITGFSESGKGISPMAAQAPQSTIVRLLFKEKEEAIEQGWTAACGGACVLWICDTVGEAQRTYERFLEKRGSTGPDVGLLHSRFTFFLRNALEERWMERLGKGNSDRGGCMLVATQVVEQSVDLDADLMITELAPTDMLLQRMGRLWRHPRSSRPLESPEFWILAEADSLESYRGWSATEIKRRLKPKGNVYAPYVLLRSWEVWQNRDLLVLPTDVRCLLNATYRERDDEPEGWRKLFEDIEGTDYAEGQLALRNTNIWQVTLADEEGRQTRLNDQPTVSLVLARDFNGNSGVLLDGSAIELTDDQFDIKVARALHQNLVRMPKWVFNHFESAEAIKRYVRGNRAVGVVGKDGVIGLAGLKDQIVVRYRDDLGVVIERKAGEDDEFGI